MSSTTLKGWLERQSKKPVSIKLTISAPQVSPKIHFSCGSALLIPCVAWTCRVFVPPPVLV